MSAFYGSADDVESVATIKRTRRFTSPAELRKAELPAPAGNRYSEAGMQTVHIEPTDPSRLASGRE